MLVSEGDAEDARMLGAVDALGAVVAGGALRVGDQPRDDQDLRLYGQPLPPDALQHLPLQRPHLVQYVHHLHSTLLILLYRRPAACPALLLEGSVWMPSLTTAGP